ncbi:MAG: hypothetical protein ACI83O_000258 [Patescibacteria group bacterium]|jgi:hypothetical protein
MGITTIQLQNETKKKISSFGTKEESYDDILQRIYSMAVKTQFRELIMSSEGTITLEDAKRELEEKWSK